MTKEQARFIAKELGGECQVYGLDFDAFLCVPVAEGVTLYLDARAEEGVRLTLRCDEDGRYPARGVDINTSLAHSIELKVAAIEHAEELCIAAGLGDPRSRT